jgi:hypothetical protein
MEANVRSSRNGVTNAGSAPGRWKRSPDLPLFGSEIDPPVLPGPDEATTPTPPFRGVTSTARHASYTGAVHAMRARGEKISAFFQLVKNHGPLTMQDAAAVLKYPLASVCSMKATLERLLEPDGHELVEWGDGRRTRRTRWRVRAGADFHRPRGGR